MTSSNLPNGLTPLPSRCAVLIPALNEAECVAETVRVWRELGFALVRVIDNGSTDTTADVARSAGADVVTEPCRGYGAAAWRGLQDLPPGIEWVLYSSADGSDAMEAHELEDWNRSALLGAEFILGDRCSDARSLDSLNPSQRWCTWIFCHVVRWAWDHQFKDVGSLRAVRVSAWPRLNLQDRAFGWNVEMQIRAIECGLRMVELPVRFRPRRAGDSKISGNWRGTLRAAWGILKLLAQLWWTRPQRKCIPTPGIAATSPDRG